MANITLDLLLIHLSMPCKCMDPRGSHLDSLEFGLHELNKFMTNINQFVGNMCECWRSHDEGY
jgi:hypothetical protein